MVKLLHESFCNFAMFEDFSIGYVISFGTITKAVICPGGLGSLNCIAIQTVHSLKLQSLAGVSLELKGEGGIDTCKFSHSSHRQLDT